jgi:hypothetical protein
VAQRTRHVIAADVVPPLVANSRFRLLALLLFVHFLNLLFHDANGLV